MIVRFAAMQANDALRLQESSICGDFDHFCHENTSLQGYQLVQPGVICGNLDTFGHRNLIFIS
ncbi:MAG: hypothetical protein ACK5SF_11815, partial [Hyphomonadaceae bacterium]